MSRSGMAARALLGVGILLGAGCSDVLSIDSDRYLAMKDAAAEYSSEAGPGDSAIEDAGSTDAANGADAAALGDDWSCLGEKPVLPDANQPLQLTLLVMDGTRVSTSAGGVDGGSDLDTVSGAGLPGVTVRPCSLLDPACTANDDAAVTTSDAGTACFGLPGTFTGYFDIRRSDLVPATLYPGTILALDNGSTFPAYDTNPTNVQALSDTVGAPASLDPKGKVGTMLVTVYDCQDHQGRGVTLAYQSSLPDASEVPFPTYFSGGLPVPGLTATDAFGLAGAVNVPSGSMVVTARLAADPSATLGTATFDVRPGALTFAWIRARTH